MLNQIVRNVARRGLQRGVQQSRLAHHESHFKYVTLDEACHPQGPWKENFAKQESKYTRQLLVGIATFVLTVAAVGHFELIYFNYSYPVKKE